MKVDKIAVAMSGGVDSSVVAAMMVEKYGAENVFGVTMRLFCYGNLEADEKSCCSTAAINDARAICEQLGIPHYALNMEKEFHEAVILDFISEYKKGRTPIPCIPCNTIIKFDYLIKKVEGMGATHLATGHYVRIAHRKHGAEKGFELLRGVDKTKDQSYFLYGLGQGQLSKILFPLGEMKKTEVRKIAAKLNLKTAEKKESQGICFISEGRVTDYLADKIKNKPGDIVNTRGEKIGSHEGIIFYTIGQRKRIGGGYAEPMFVVRINVPKNEVVIGTKSELYQKELSIKEANWIAGRSPVLSHKYSAKIRYNMEDEECEIRLLDDGGYGVIFKEPQRAITPGQSAVFYNADEVLGGGIISE
jgi:tRNA-uridine 2-sulfurtransferase